MPTKRKTGANPLFAAFSERPLFIAPDSAETVGQTIQFLSTDEEAKTLISSSPMAFAGTDGQDEFWGSDDHPYRPYVVHNGVLQIPVMGVLMNRFSYQFGRYATGYQYIEKALSRGLADPEVKGIALICDSPGGEVSGCFELADKIYEGRSVKPIRAFAADRAYSAAYALASSAGDVSVTRSGGVGSIGVVTMHVDFSENIAKQGVKVTFIFAGSHKVDGNPYEKLPEDAKARIQVRIDRLYGVFTGTVARNRGIDDKDVRATEALTFDATDAVDKLLADRIGALDEEMVVFMNEVAEAEDEQMSFTQEQMDTAVAAAKADGVAEGKAAGMTEGANAERERATAIMALEESKTRPAAANMMVELGVSAETAKDKLAKMPEEATAAAPKGKEAPKGNEAPKGSAFERMMDSTGNPEVGADSNTEGEDKMSVEDKIFGSIGIPPVQPRN